MVARPEADRITQVEREYLAYAFERDGAADVAARKLSNREEWLAARLATRVTFEGLPSPHDFYNRAHSVDSGATSDLIQWLRRVNRVNELEAWNVDQHLRRHGVGDYARAGLYRARIIADLEEVYHTRILAVLLESFGIEFRLRRPNWALRILAKLTFHLPRAMAFFFILSAEMIGAVAIADIADEGRQVLATEPAAREYVGSLLDEILVDEIGHAMLLLAVIGPLGRLMLPLINRLALAYMRMAYYRDRPDAFRRIAPKVKHFRLDNFPRKAADRAFVPAALK